MKKYLTTAITLSILVTGAYAQQSDAVEQARQKHEAAASKDTEDIANLSAIHDFHEKERAVRTQKIYEAAEKYWAGKPVPAEVVKSGQALEQFNMWLARFFSSMRDDERMSYLQEAEKHAKNIKFDASSKAQHDQLLALASRLGQLRVTCEMASIRARANPGNNTNPANEECSKLYKVQDPLGKTYTVQLRGYTDKVHDAAASRIPGVKADAELYQCVKRWSRTKVMPAGCPDFTTG